MLISRVEEEGETMGGGHDGADVDNHSHEYQTANELFELMAKNNNFKPNDDESLTTRDLVLLYKNIDLGTKLMSNANEFKKKTPNQYVETVVYNEDPETDSDISEIYSSEDLHNVVLINKERIDLLTNPPSLENTLCQKIGDLEIKKSDLSTEYDRKYMLKNPYMKEQLKSFNLVSGSNGLEGTLPASLLDYICCKRLEDNYNFYMDNIIRYVKHTIEQLKRISNGDYLTDKAKEKWREIENYTKNDEPEDNNTKILKSSTSIPLHVERKITGRVTTWDDIIHSEVDIRSLSKILEKKIVFEVPKLICGSYRIFSKFRADNLIVSCKKEIKSLLVESRKEESRVDVIFQLSRSESGHVISNISSIMILQNACEQKGKISSNVILSLPYKEADNIQTTKEEHDVIVVDDRDNNNYSEHNENKNATASFPQQIDIESDMESTEYESLSLNTDYSSARNTRKNRTFKKRCNQIEAAFDLLPPDDLRLTMQRLNMQSTLPEESAEDSVSVNTATRKKSPTRNRVKSPYENKSFVMEEKKRKRLLEIRQRREKRKIAMTEKVSKNRYGKGIIMPLTSNSVTKLSITNKSFYNSIYGQSGVNGDHKPTKLRLRKDKKDTSPEMSSESVKAPVISSQNFINRSYYLDDTLTEMMYLQMKKTNSGKEAFSESTSAVSTDFNTNLKIFSSLIVPSASELNACDLSMPSHVKCQGLKDILKNMDPNNRNRKSLASSQSSINLLPVTTTQGDPNDHVYCDKNDPKKSSTSVEFRKSINKIYDLMKKIGKPDGTEAKLTKSKFTAAGTDTFNDIDDRGSSIVQCSDSGTSIKHHLTSSNPSCFSFEKANNADFPKAKITNRKKFEMPPNLAMVPKVIISTKSPTQKVDEEKPKRDRKRTTSCRSPKETSDNPLKAISQLLHEFDNVQKNRFRQQSGSNLKIQKKSDVPEGKNTSRQVSHRKNSRLEQHIKDNELQAEKFTRLHAIKEKKPKLIHTSESSRLPRQQINVKKQVSEIIDEVKESRGEAVRGPSKLNSRLNTLAQPKRTYVQAHVEEFQSKYGKNRMSDRLQKLAGGPHSSNQENNVLFYNLKHKHKRSGTDMPTVSVKPPPASPASLDKPARPRPLCSNSAEVTTLPLLTDKSYKQSTGANSPNSIKKKMVAVESYVKNHYGRSSPTMERSELLRGGQQSRAPLLPNDFELSSLTSSLAAEASATIGSRLHHIIDDMMIPSTPPLTFLSDCNETSNKQCIDKNEETPLVENVCKEELSTSYSDYHNNKFKDNLISTSGLENSSEAKDDQNDENNFFQKLTSQIDAPLAKQSYSSNEMEKLESALYRRISVGTFQKRLRIKNLTLTPKQSMQQVLLLQSGDARPVVLKSTISQKIEVSKSKSDAKDLNTLTGLSDSPLEWGFTNFPVQIATVGYAFPVTQKFPGCSKSNVLSLETDADSHKSKKLSQNTKAKKRIKSANAGKVKQCYEDLQSESHLGQGNQTNVENYKATSNSIQINHPSIENSGKEEPNDNFQTSIIKKKNLDCNKLAESVNGKTKISEIIKINIKEQTHAKEDTSVNYSTSLDILAGLLNEIQKITTCQTQMVNSDSGKYYDLDNRNRELETILNEAAAIESAIQNNAHQIISISSLDKLRQLESNPSIYSLYVSNDGDDIKIDITEATEGAKDKIKKSDITTVDEIVETFEIFENDKNLSFRPVCADKEVTVEFPSKELVNNFPASSSRRKTITVNNSTTLSNSMLGVFNRPSNLSMLSFNENNALFSLNKKLIELPKGATKIKESKECQCSVLVNEDKKGEDNLNSNEMQIESKTVNDSIGKSVKIKKVTQLSCAEKNIVVNDSIGKSVNIKEVTQLSCAEKNIVVNDSIGKSVNIKKVTQLGCAEKNIVVNDSIGKSVNIKEVTQLSCAEKNIVVNDSIGKSVNIKKVPQLSCAEKNIVGKHYNVSSEFDPGFKMKRDILVTVYSILVFTVFAALSFPEFLYHV